MQRLASEISEVELCLSQKEREAALLQKHLFSDLISQRKRKGLGDARNEMQLGGSIEHKSNERG